MEGSDRACPLVSLISCFWGIQQNRSSTAHSWYFFYCQSCEGGQSKPTCASSDREDISHVLCLILLIWPQGQHQFLCGSPALNLLLPPAHMFACTWPQGWTSDSLKQKTLKVSGQSWSPASSSSGLHAGMTKHTSHRPGVQQAAQMWFLQGVHVVWMRTVL